MSRLQKLSIDWFVVLNSFTSTHRTNLVLWHESEWCIIYSIQNRFDTLSVSLSSAVLHCLSLFYFNVWFWLFKTSPPPVTALHAHCLSNPSQTNEPVLDGTWWSALSLLVYHGVLVSQGQMYRHFFICSLLCGSVALFYVVLLLVLSHLSREMSLLFLVSWCSVEASLPLCRAVGGVPCSDG